MLMTLASTHQSIGKTIEFSQKARFEALSVKVARKRPPQVVKSPPLPSTVAPNPKTSPRSRYD